jgi:hypothetical protein
MHPQIDTENPEAKALGVRERPRLPPAALRAGVPPGPLAKRMPFLGDVRQIPNQPPFLGRTDHPPFLGRTDPLKNSGVVI